MLAGNSDCAGYAVEDVVRAAAAIMSAEAHDLTGCVLLVILDGPQLEIAVVPRSVVVKTVPDLPKVASGEILLLIPDRDQTIPVVCDSRAFQPRSRAALGTKTAIAVPTNELAIQVTADLRAGGTRTLRIFGPLSVRNAANDGPECRYFAAAEALVRGGQSVREALCRDCSYRDTCKATGCDGDTNAPVIVGTHAMLAELSGKAGKTGLLIIDEPAQYLVSERFTETDLREAEKQLEYFEPRYAAAMAPVLRAVKCWAFERASLDEACPTSALARTDPPLLARNGPPSGGVMVGATGRRGR